MIIAIITVSGVLISYKISNNINKKVDKKFIKAYKEMAEEKNGNWVNIEKLINDFPQFFKMGPNSIQEYLPLYNILYSLYRRFSSDYYPLLVENFVDWYDARIIPPDGTIDPETFEPKDEDDVQEYFIGYNNEKKRRVNVFFEYDGQTTTFTDDTSDEFNNLPAEEQMKLFTEILYKIYMGQDREYASSQDIRKLFNAQLVTVLKLINETDDFEIHFNEEEEEPLVRKRTK